MKSMTQVKITFLALIAGLIAFAGAAKAQSPYQGKFTLPEATRFGQIELPAGDYTFSVRPTQTNTPFVIIADAHGKLMGMTRPVTTEAMSQADGQDCLMLGRNAKGAFVTQLRLGSAMLVLGYASTGHSGGAGESSAIKINSVSRPHTGSRG